MTNNTDRTGQQLGNYILTRLLGRGGFAEVYLGEHIYLKTQAAIKVLLTQLSTHEMESFLNEARTIANLRHANIVRVLEFGVHDSTPYLVMDYAAKGTLRQRYPRGTQLTPSIIVPYVKQIAAGLQYAHDQKLIHRDVKPENLLVGTHDEILLSDFGIAVVAQSSLYQSTQDVVGTVAYMSPEQIQGKPRSSSDQYSLGIVVYEWLTGDRPFHGSFTELCAQHLYASPPPLRQHIPTISPEIEEVVNTALAKDPKQRYLTIQAFADALEAASLGHSPTILKSPPLKSTSSLPPTQPVEYSSSPLFTPSQLERRIRSDAVHTSSEVQSFPQVLEERSAAKIWGIGVRQVVFMALGAALYGGLSYLTNVLQLPATSNVSFRPAIVIPLFFGVVFGPWVGLFTGGVGNFLGDYISGYGVFWNWDVGNALIGFIAGLAIYLTWGRYNTTLKIVIAEIFAAVGVVVGIGLAAYSDIWVSKYNFAAASGNFVPATLSDLVNGIILLPILLVAYNAAMRRAGRG